MKEFITACKAAAEVITMLADLVELIDGKITASKIENFKRKVCEVYDDDEKQIEETKDIEDAFNDLCS